MDALNVTGIVLQVVGVAIAMAGVSRLHRDLTSKSIPEVLLADIAERWRSWRNRKDARVTPGSASGTVSVGAAGVGTVTDGEELPADPADQIAFLHRRLKALKDLIDSERKWNDGQHAQLRTEAEATAERLGEQIGEVERMVVETRVALGGGPSGEGLRIAAGGLALTIVGLVLTLVAACP